ALHMRFDPGRRIQQHKGNLRRRRNIDFGAHRTNLRYEIDDEADFGLRGGLFIIFEFGPWRECEKAIARMLLWRCERPKLLGEKRHEGMQELDDLLADKGGRLACLNFIGTVVALKEGFGKLEIPVAKNIPDEFIDRIRRIVETVALNRRRHLGDRL